MKKTQTAPQHIQKLRKILTAVSQVTGVDRGLIKETFRDAYITEARQMYCYVASATTDIASIEIGSYINRDHASVIYSRTKCEHLMTTDREYSEKVEKIMSMVNHQDKPARIAFLQKTIASYKFELVKLLKEVADEEQQ